MVRPQSTLGKNLVRCRLLSAFLRSHRKEGSGLLMYVFTAAFRTRDLALFVFGKREDDLEGLLAIFTEELVARHGDPQSKAPRENSTAPQGLHVAPRKTAPLPVS